MRDIDDPLSEVRDAAGACRAAGGGTTALARRDAAIRRAAKFNHIQRTQIAEAAGISRERLYQILGPAAG